MRYWWVNQNQTYEHEISGGYLWSPKRKSNGGRNPFYEFMREVSPGDVIFSFKSTYIPSIGIAQSYCYECLKPTEFGNAGQNWELIGWMIDVNYLTVTNPIRPKDHINVLKSLLPEKYSPLQITGDGNQGVYLTELPQDLAEVLLGLSHFDVSVFSNNNKVEEAAAEYKPKTNSQSEWENQIEKNIESDDHIQETERTALVQARKGQGRFKSNVSKIETKCRITHVDRMEHLRASHLKPWRDSSNQERLDGENGFLLTPTIDHLFDRGFISFEDSGVLLLSPVAHKPTLEKMGVQTTKPLNVGSFTNGQKQYLDFHRGNIFLEKR